MWKAMVHFFGRLMINENGITVLPKFAGYSIAWSELERWDVNLNSHNPEGHSIRFWTATSPSALFVPNRFLTSQDRAEIRHWLMHYAANKALPLAD
jgi:hypothetical protein